MLCSFLERLGVLAGASSCFVTQTRRLWGRGQVDQIRPGLVDCREGALRGRLCGGRAVPWQLHEG